jgi:CheY-like chemotaxis protein/HPt (histidine-containing phosphotransfer) domain-containing protein
MRMELGERHVAQADTAPSKMAGTVLVYGELESDRSLLGGWLGKLGLQVMQAGEQNRVTAALKGGGVNAIVIDLDLADADAVQVVKELRDQGFVGPIIATTMDPDEQHIAVATAAGCNAVLGKPCERAAFETTIQQLCDATVSDADAAPIHSTFAGDADMQHVLVAFMADVKKSLANLDRATRDADAALLGKLCKQLKASATSCGFPPLAEAATAAVAAATSATPDTNAIKASVDALIKVCHRVRAQ